MTRAIRGAVQLNSDNKEEITEKVRTLVERMLSDNGLSEEDVVSIIFSVTADIKSVNPAAALRAGGGYKVTPLFCAQEPECTGSMPKIIRVMMTAEADIEKKDIVHVYTGGAERLRPDLS